MAGCEWLDSLERLCSYNVQASGGTQAALSLDTGAVAGELRSGMGKILSDLDRVLSSAKRETVNGVEYLVFSVDAVSVESNPVLRALRDAGFCIERGGQCAFAVPSGLIGELRRALNETASIISSEVGGFLSRFSRGVEEGRREAERVQRLLAIARIACSMLPRVERFLRSADCDLIQAAKRIGEECARGHDKVDQSVVACARPLVDALWDIMRLAIEACRASGGRCEEPPKAMYDALIAATMTAALRTVAGESWSRVASAGNPLAAIGEFFNAVGQTLMYAGSALTEPILPVAMEVLKGDLSAAWEYIAWSAGKVWSGILGFLDRLVHGDIKGVMGYLSGLGATLGRMAGDPDFWAGFVTGVLLSLGVGAAAELAEQAISRSVSRIAARIASRVAAEAGAEADEGLLSRVVASVVSRAVRLGSRLSGASVEEALSRLAYSLARRLASRFAGSATREVVEEVLGKLLSATARAAKGFAEIGVEVGTGGLYPGPISRLTGGALALAVRGLARGLARLRSLVGEGRIGEALDQVSELLSLAANMPHAERERLERIGAVLRELREELTRIERLDIENVDADRVASLLHELNNLLELTLEQRMRLYSRLGSSLSRAAKRLAKELRSSVAAAGDNIGLAIERLKAYLAKANRLAELVNVFRDWDPKAANEAKSRIGSALRSAINALLDKLGSKASSARTKSDIERLLGDAKRLGELLEELSFSYPDLAEAAVDALRGAKSKLSSLVATLESKLRSIEMMNVVKELEGVLSSAISEFGSAEPNLYGVRPRLDAVRAADVLGRVSELLGRLAEAARGGAAPARSELHDVIGLLESVLRRMARLAENGVSGDANRLESLLSTLESRLRELEELGLAEEVRGVYDAISELREALGGGAAAPGVETRIERVAPRGEPEERVEHETRPAGAQTLQEVIVERVDETGGEAQGKTGRNADVVGVGGRGRGEESVVKVIEVDKTEFGGGATDTKTNTRSSDTQGGGSDNNPQPKSQDNNPPPKPQPKQPDKQPQPKPPSNTPQVAKVVEIKPVEPGETRVVVSGSVDNEPGVAALAAYQPVLERVESVGPVEAGGGGVIAESRGSTAAAIRTYVARSASAQLSGRIAVSTPPSLQQPSEAPKLVAPEAQQPGASAITRIVGAALAAGLFGAVQRLISEAVAAARQRRRRSRRKREGGFEEQGMPLYAARLEQARLRREEWMPL